MVAAVVAFLSAVGMSCVLTLTIRELATRYGWSTGPRSTRNVHSAPTPRIGGVAIVLGFFSPLVALLFFPSVVGELYRTQTPLVVGLFGGGIAIALLGLYDDFRGAGALKKLGVQLPVCVGLWFLGFRIEEISHPFGPAFQLGILSLPFTLIWMVGLINAMNLIDGLDGLAGGVAFFAVLTNFVLAVARGDILLTLLLAALAGALIGFLIFNFNPASIFMGDTGSMFLGFVLAAVSIKTSSKSGAAVSLLVPVIAMGLPVIDTLLTIVRRTAMGRSMFSADKEHIHHRVMSRLIYTQRAAVIWLYGLCCVFTLGALALAFANSRESFLVLFALGIVVFVVMRKLGYLDAGNVQRASASRRRNVELKSVTRKVIDTLAQARNQDEIWNALKHLFDEMDMSSLLLVVEHNDFTGATTQIFEATRPGDDHTPMKVAMELRREGEPLGHIHAVWQDGRAAVDRDEELALDIIADAVGKALWSQRLNTYPTSLRPGLPLETPS